VDLIPFLVTGKLAKDVFPDPNSFYRLSSALGLEID